MALVQFDSSTVPASPTNVNGNFNYLDGKIDDNTTAIGTLADLDTTDKTSLVNAVNEVVSDVNTIDVRDTYSTTEQVIGTWVDGKPLYRKTIEITNPSVTGTDVWTNHGIANVDNIMIDYAHTYGLENSNRFGIYVPMSLNNSGIPYMFQVSVATPSQILYICGASRNLSKIIVTLEYTKTTD